MTIYVKCGVCGKPKKATGRSYFKCCGIFQDISKSKVSEVRYNITSGKTNVGGYEGHSPYYMDSSEVEVQKVETPTTQTSAREKLQVAKEPLEVEFSKHEAEEEEEKEEEVEEEPKPKAQREADYACGNCGRPVRKGQPRCHGCFQVLEWDDV